MNNQNSSIPNKPEPKKWKLFISKTWSIILGISGLVIIMLIIGGGALLASHVWNPSWNPFGQHQDKGIKDKIFKK